MDSEEQELKEYEKQLEMYAASEKMIAEYKELLPLTSYPPLNLKKNYASFNSDIVNLVSRIGAAKTYDPSLMGNFIKKWKNEIDEAKKNSKDASISPREAAIEYIKKNPKITLQDFAQ